MYAEHKGLPLDDVEVRLRHDRVHLDDCEADCDDAVRAGADRHGRIERIERHIDLTGDLTEQQRARLLQIADRCPVHRTITGTPHMVLRLAEPDPDDAS
jgi:putative redox protein